MQIITNGIRFVCRINTRCVIKRNCHSSGTTSSHCSHADANEKDEKSNSVRVRFAPSPTGYLHLGGLRTALYNFLFARAKNGKFVVRIEDTDQSRLVPDAVQTIFNDLEWAGIIPDESLIHGGDFGPYEQSKRLDIYRSEVKKLLENGTAYYCFCTSKRLEQLRKVAEREKQIPGYDNNCRLLTPVQIAAKLANEDAFCVRFKIDPQVIEYDDLVAGHIRHEYAAVEGGDPVIIKSDGYPTYHFANVVDDHLMRITHVLRGIEWQPSTPKHLQLYRAFGWTPPQFAHLPLLLNHDGSKVSKRQNHANIEYYRAQNILPQALINYVTRTGGGFPHVIGAKPKSYTMAELQERFDLTNICTHSARLSTEQLEECTRLEIIEHINDPIKCDALVQKIRVMIQKAYPNEVDELVLERAHIRNVLHWASDRITSLNQLVEGNLSFLWILPKIKNDDIHAELLESLIAQLEKGDFDKQNLLALLQEFSKKNDLKFSKFMRSLRATLSGISDGPGVAEIMAILGKKVTISRFRKNLPKKNNRESAEQK